jgi:Flp pilus assembly protein TadB
MSRAVLALATVGFVGLVLVLPELPWFGRRSLGERLRPYTPGAPSRSTDGGLLSVDSFRDVVAPLAHAIGTRVAAAFGVNEDLAVRLHRVHSTVDPTAFRVRQVAWSFAALVGAGALAATAHVPPVGALLALVGAPLLSFLVLEQRIAARSARWQRRIFLELPVIAEQLGMLLGAGYSLAAALNRIAQRGNGACAADLRRVCTRMRQGLSDTAALDEWAVTADVPALSRLVGVLALNRQAADLSRLIADEARAVRRDAQRDLIEAIERRTQMVWIPVTVAALIPGVIFMAVPFVQALSLFSGS